jgi:hypothetical protein
MDYKSLINQIISYTNRNEPVFISNIPDLINQAMSNIYSRAKTIGFQKTVELQMQPNIPFISKPIDYKATVNLQYFNDSNVVFLLPRSYEFCTTYWPDEEISDQNSPPLFYSADMNVPQNNAGGTPPRIYIAPTPAIAYPYSLTYLSFPPIFNEVVNQNFLTDKYPNLLLYGCMVQAIPFLKSDERAALFTSLYEKELENINKDTVERYTDRITKRNKD